MKLLIFILASVISLPSLAGDFRNATILNSVNSYFEAQDQRELREREAARFEWERRRHEHEMWLIEQQKQRANDAYSQRELQSNANGTPANQEKIDIEYVQRAINKNVLLKSWQDFDADKFNRAKQVDKVLRANPAIHQMSLEDRFGLVTQIVDAIK